MARPTNYNRILNFLHSCDEPVIAKTVSIYCGITPRQAGSFLKILVSKGKVSVRRPLRHQGERFPALYWYKEGLNE